MKFLFLLSWVEGSDEAIDNEHRGVKNQDDLLPQFIVANDGVLALIVDLKGCNLPQHTQEEIASAFGFAHALNNNYTGYNTTSICMVDIVDHKPSRTPRIIIIDFKPV